MAPAPSRRSAARVRASESAPVSLRLYVAGRAPNSEQARANLATILDTSVPRAKLEVVDVLAEPGRAMRDGIIVTPTLMRQGTSPVRVVGNLADLERVRATLGMVKV